MVNFHGCGGGIITNKFTYAAAAVLCVIFSALPFATAAEIQDMDVNQNVSVNTSKTNSTTYQDLKNSGLKIGSEGNYVVELQTWLKNQGYYTGELDGSFGPYTKKAVILFQKDAKIVVDGWVANQTINSMEKITGNGVFTKSNSSKTNYTNINKFKSSKKKSSDVSATNSTTSKKTEKTEKKVSKKIQTTKTKIATTKASTSSITKKDAIKSAATSSSLSQILASGAKYGYSHSASTASGLMSIGSGDCWAMSDYLYSKLRAAGIKSRIVQYSTKYSARHRSVQLYKNGVWVDVPYSSYGYSTMFKATSSKPGMTVIASF